MKRKLAGEGGLTLIELLAGLVVLILLVLLLNTGLQMAVRSYNASIAQSEVNLLLSTLADALADDLRYADAVKAGAGGVTYNSDSFGENATPQVGSDGQLYISGQRLLPASAYRHGAYIIEKMDLQYADSRFDVHLKVRQAQGTIFAEADFSVCCLNPEKKEEPAP